MKILRHLQTVGRTLDAELRTYRLMLGHPETPWTAKLLLGLAAGYALLPFDLVPDFVPLIGHLDDLILVPALVIAARRLIPEAVVEECRTRAGQS